MSITINIYCRSDEPGMFLYCALRNAVLEYPTS